jgi:hypothetical protein
MGYSATTIAFNKLNKLEDFCRKTTNSSNTWKVGNTEYFFEVNTDKQDGSIHGYVEKMVPGGCIRVGNFFISKDGKNISFPGVPPSVWKA